MKKILLSLFAVALSVATVFAQAPEKMNYQGVARDNSGNVLPNQAVGLQIKLRSGSSGGAVVYQEAHTASTNAFGLFNVQIGGGTVQSGTFSSIAWGSNTYYVEVLMDASGGTSYTSMGTQQLVSVPYALNAKSAANVSGTTNYVSKFTSGTTLGNSQLFDDGVAVGIGTTSAAYNKLSVYGAASSAANGPHQSFFAGTDPYPTMQLMNWGATEQALMFSSYLATANDWTSSTADGNFMIHRFGDRLNFEYASGVAPGNSIGWNNGMVLSNAGNVGVGTTAPTSRFSVRSGSNAEIASFGADASPYISIYSGGNYVGYLGAYYNGSADLEVGSSSGKVHLITGGSADLTAAAGRIGIATTTPLSDLDIAQSGGSSTDQQSGGINLRNAAYHWRIYNSNDFVRFNYSNNSGSTYTAKAYVSSTDGSWNQLSDASLKRDIEPVGSVLSSVLQLNPVTYYYNDNDADDAKSIGFLAQEVQKVFPTFVSQEKGESLLGIDYSKFAVISIKAIQEQQELIKKLETRIKALEAK
ncbi:MAG: tail fiber domain-containing protein [Bacteroidia bacterium]